MDASVSMQYAGMTTLDAYLAVIETYIIKQFSNQIDNPPKSTKPTQHVKLFACAFGLNHPQSLFTQAQHQSVKNLWKNDQDQSVISLSSLVHHWDTYSTQIRTIQPLMHGTSTLLAGLEQVETIFEQQNQKHRYGNKILIILSDGQASDGSAEEVIAAIDTMQQQNIVIVSLYISKQASVATKQIYSYPLPHWNQGAKLMFDCASMMSHEAFLFAYLKGHQWDIPTHGKLFTQIPIASLVQASRAITFRQRSKKYSKPKGIFIAYSEQDEAWLKQLEPYLLHLEHDSRVHHCSDKQYQSVSHIPHGWDNHIEATLLKSQIAIVLISSHFMASAFIAEDVLAVLLRRAKRRGTEVILLIAEPSRLRYVDSMKKFKSINSANQPLSALLEEEQDVVFSRLTQQIETALYKV